MTPTDTTELLYFGGTSSDAPMVMERVNDGTLTAYNIGRDHIGTVTHVFTAGGALVAEYSYDPWGRPRDPSTHALTGTLSAPEPRFHRGFAGHEWIAACALWNMNARLYDPAFGVFLSPDPYVQVPDFTENLNRYCYCLGNPLKYTDPEGEFWNYIIGALIGGISNWIANGCEFTWEGLGYFGAGAAIGVLTSGTAAFTTTAFSACGVATGALVGATTGAATGAATGFLSNGLNNLVSGNKFMDGAWDATRSGMISGAISGVFSGGIAGGKKALESGKNVWWGSEVKNGRTQWSFFSSEKPYASIDYDINTISNNVNDCAPASFTEINDYYGGGKSYQDMCDRLGYKDGDGVVTTPGKLKNLAGELFSTKDIKLSQLSNIDFATGLQRDNKIISVLFNYDSNVKHMDVIRSIRYYSTKTVIKFRIGSYTLNSLVNKTYWALSISGLKY